VLSARCQSAARTQEQRTDEHKNRTEESTVTKSPRTLRKQEESLPKFSQIKFNLASTHAQEIIAWDRPKTQENQIVTKNEKGETQENSKNKNHR
jgi:hypothetical protein